MWFQSRSIFPLCFYHNTCHMSCFLYQDFWILPNTKPIHEKERSFHDIVVCHICSTFWNALEITKKKVFSWSKTKFAYLSKLIYLSKQYHKSSPSFTDLWFYNLFPSNLLSAVPKLFGWLFSFNLKTSLSFCYSHISKGVMPWKLPRICFSHWPSIGLNLFEEGLWWWQCWWSSARAPVPDVPHTQGQVLLLVFWIYWAQVEKNPTCYSSVADDQRLALHWKQWDNLHLWL